MCQFFVLVMVKKERKQYYWIWYSTNNKVIRSFWYRINLLHNRVTKKRPIRAALPGFAGAAAIQGSMYGDGGQTTFSRVKQVRKCVRARNDD